MIADYFEGELKRKIGQVENNYKDLEEIRIRAGKRIMIKIGGICEFLCETVSKEQLQNALMCMCEYSLYAYSEEIAQGYICTRDGYRIGLAGESGPTNDGRLDYHSITAMNIRIHHEKSGISGNIFDSIYSMPISNGRRIPNVLITSPPGRGKTTLLRDLIRKLADCKLNICVIDERYEIADSKNGICAYNLGECTDIISGVSKTQGMKIAIKTLNPRVIAMDEIDSLYDMNEIKRCYVFGVSILATMHLDEDEGLPETIKNVFDARISIGYDRTYKVTKLGNRK